MAMQAIDQGLLLSAFRGQQIAFECLSIEKMEQIRRFQILESAHECISQAQEQLLSELDELSEVKKALEEENASLKADFSELKNCLTDLETQKNVQSKEILKLKAELEEPHENLEVLEENRSLLEENRRLRAELERAQEQANETKQSHKRAIERKDIEAQAKINQTALQVNEQEKKFSQLKEENLLLNQQHTTLKLKLEQVSNEHARDHEQTISHFQSERESLMKTIETLKLSLQKKIEQEDVLKQQSLQLEAVLEEKTKQQARAHEGKIRKQQEHYEERIREQEKAHIDQTKKLEKSFEERIQQMEQLFTEEINKSQIIAQKEVQPVTLADFQNVILAQGCQPGGPELEPEVRKKTQLLANQIATFSTQFSAMTPGTQREKDLMTKTAILLQLLDTSFESAFQASQWACSEISVYRARHDALLLKLEEIEDELVSAKRKAKESTNKLVLSQLLHKQLLIQLDVTLDNISVTPTDEDVTKLRRTNLELQRDLLKASSKISELRKELEVTCEERNGMKDKLQATHESHVEEMKMHSSLNWKTLLQLQKSFWIKLQSL